MTRYFIMLAESIMIFNLMLLAWLIFDFYKKDLRGACKKYLTKRNDKNA